MQGPIAGPCPECESEDTVQFVEWPVNDPRAIALRKFGEAIEAIDLTRRRRTMQ